jgi:hypothetical protein
MPCPHLRVRFEHEGTLGRYFVQSQRLADQQYLVDLSCYAGNGKCGCRDFEIHREPKLCRLPPSEWRAHADTYRCKHIIAAILYEGIVLCESRLKAEAATPSRYHEHQF